jgi:hypothetical protein
MATTHEHDDDCHALFREWQRYARLADDRSGPFDANDIGNARRQREMFARQLRARGCSPEAHARD